VQSSLLQTQAGSTAVIYDSWLYFLIESLDVLMAAGWNQAAGHHGHPFSLCYQIQFKHFKCQLSHSLSSLQPFLV
jgi:hypothetical protein